MKEGKQRREREWKGGTVIREGPQSPNSEVSRVLQILALTCLCSPPGSWWPLWILSLCVNHPSSTWNTSQLPPALPTPHFPPDPPHSMHSGLLLTDPLDDY